MKHIYKSTINYNRRQFGDTIRSRFSSLFFLDASHDRIFGGNIYFSHIWLYTILAYIVQLQFNSKLSRQEFLRNLNDF